jgi:hypothetical protein
VMDRDIDRLVSELVFAAQSDASGPNAELMKRAANALSWMSFCFRMANERHPVNHRVDLGTVSQREAV